MKHFVGLALAALLAIAPALAQAPKGWKMHGDHSSEASDPDAPGANKFVVSGSGFHATNPMAAIYWNPANTATGNYTLKGTFKLNKSTGYDEYYGLIFGGSALEGAVAKLLVLHDYGRRDLPHQAARRVLNTRRVAQDSQRRREKTRRRCGLRPTLSKCA